MPKRICLTGGGSAGHVLGHFAILPGLRERGWQVFYVGSNGIEKQLVAQHALDFHEIAAGKLRRYASLANLVDVFKVAWGCWQSLRLLYSQRPDLVFSKGGFVSVPVCVAAWILRVPILSHESDLTPGLATRIIARLARRILYTFEESKRYLPESAIRVGSPVRTELLEGQEMQGMEFCQFNTQDDAQVLLVMGGSLGAENLNRVVEAALPDLTARYRVIHLTGRGKLISFSHPRYRSFEFVNAELKDILAITDLVVARAGANAIFEFLALNKPMLLVPLESGSRGDQIDNAAAFSQKGWARVVRERELDTKRFLKEIYNLEKEAENIRDCQKQSDASGAIIRVLKIIDATVEDKRRQSTDLQATR